MNRVLKVVIVCVVSSLCVPAAAYAQASIAGVVKDTSGGVLPPIVDVFNVTNGNAVTLENPSYGTFRTPISITQGRLVKFSLNVTF